MPRSPRFVDMVSGEPALYDTRMACQWDDVRFYVAYWVEEPQVRATLTERDSFIWNDNDVELFVGGDDCYYELEINAFGTVYEVFLVWQDALKRGSRFDRPELDLYGGNVDLLGGFQDAEPLGQAPPRAALRVPGLRPRRARDRGPGRRHDQRPVHDGPGLDGRDGPPLEEPRLPVRRADPAPGEGETLRCDFSRFEALRVHGKPLPENPGWSLNPHGVYDSHIPESFSVVHFTEKTAG